MKFRYSLLAIISFLMLWFCETVIRAVEISARQPWQQVISTCPPELAGAVFGLPDTGCGGTGTTFDQQEAFLPVVLKDAATAAAPCEGIATGETCYRMWYVGRLPTEIYAIGYATSPDGINWSRVIGSAEGGAVFGRGPEGRFDRSGAGYFSIIKDGDTFKMWYAGVADDYFESLGYATSSNGKDWTRIDGAAGDGAILRPSGTSGAFDRDVLNTPYVIKDRASDAAPCDGVATGAVCYRMWFEGVNFTDSSYTFRIGYATSPDGLDWARVPGQHADGSTLSTGSGFDNNSIGIPIVMKDGPLYRMWYEAKNYSDEFTIGHVVSLDGRTWQRPDPNLPVWTAADDPGTFTEDKVWNVSVLKEQASYRMWYGVTTHMQSDRIGYAEMTPGSLLENISLSNQGELYTLRFTTSNGIPADGFVLITLPETIAPAAITAGGVSGFGSSSLRLDPAAVTDAASQRVARPALVLQAAETVDAGAKELQFTVSGGLTSDAEITVQSFDLQDVLEYAIVRGDGQILPTETVVPTEEAASPTLEATATEEAANPTLEATTSPTDALPSPTVEATTTLEATTSPTDALPSPTVEVTATATEEAASPTLEATTSPTDALPSPTVDVTATATEEAASPTNTAVAPSPTETSAPSSPTATEVVTPSATVTPTSRPESDPALVVFIPLVPLP